MSKKQQAHEEVYRDEVAEGLQDALRFLQRHYVKIIAAVVVILLVVVVRNTSQQRQARITSELNVIASQAISEFQNVRMSTDLESRQALARQLAEELDRQIAEYGNHPLAHQLLFLKGRVLYEADLLEEAQAAYQQFTDQATTEEMRARGDIALAYAYENQSFLDPERQRDLLTSAMARYQTAASRVPGSYTYYYALMGQARVHELLGEDQEAIDLYHKVVTERQPAREVTAPEGPLTTQLDVMRAMLAQAMEPLSFHNSAELRLSSLMGRTGLKPTGAQEEAAETATP